MSEPHASDPGLPRWLWLWFPPLMLLVQFLVRGADQRIYLHYIESEQGLVENGTFAVLLLAVVFGILALRRRRLLPSPWVAGWVLLVTLGCVYMGGEEVSWGQQWFHWHTPAEIAAINDQQETNLHNTSSWFDQKPRILLELWVLIGGVVLTLRNRLRGSTLHPAGGWRAWFWPAWWVFPAAALAIGVHVVDYVRTYADLPPTGFMDLRYSESQEYYFGLFLMLYLMSIRARLRAAEARAAAPARGVAESDVTRPARRRAARPGS